MKARIDAEEAAKPSDPVTIVAEKAPAGRFSVAGRLQRDGTMTLTVNGEVVAGGKADRLPQENLSVGFDAQQPITDYGSLMRFAGTIERLAVDVQVAP